MKKRYSSVLFRANKESYLYSKKDARFQIINIRKRRRPHYLPDFS